jgi:hypothetical protein
MIEGAAMNPAQKKVALGAGSGILSMVLLVIVLSVTLAAPQDVTGLAGRIAYALGGLLAAAYLAFVAA